MYKKIPGICQILLLTLVGLVGALSALAQSGSFQGVVGNGGGEVSGGDYQLQGTLGQPAVGQASNQSHVLELGFWYIPYGDVSPVDLQDLIPAVFNLEQNYPNPFNPATTIGFAVPKQSRVTINLYNLRGLRVKSIADQVFEPGWHMVTFDGKELASGVYFCRMVADDYVETVKMTLMK